METLLHAIQEANGVLNDFAWGPLMLLLLVGTGAYLTLRTGCIQVRRFGFILRNTVGTLFRPSDKDHGENLSPFQAVSTALAGTVGTGNIAGVTGAIFIGGPGAVFWMWVSAFLGMCTKYAEIALAIRFRNKDENGVHYGGPMYYIENGLGKNWKWLAVVFSILGVLASFGIGNIAQGSEIAGAVVSLAGAQGSAASAVSLAVGLILAAVVAVVVLGGVKRIGQVTSYLVPFMAAFYILAGVVLIVLRIDQVPQAFADILAGAFSLRSVGGGAAGYGIMVAMRQGVARGVFSNEAGLGSAPIAHAASSTEEPAEQAIWGVFEVFVDTIVICTITSLVVLLSGLDLGEAALAGYSSNGAAAAAAFNTILPGNWGGMVLQVSLLFFALSTILSWSYYGSRCLGYLSGNNRMVDRLYKLVFIAVCVVGATGSGSLMWEISDTLNGLMALPNLIALLLLSGTVIEITRDYFGRKGKQA